MEQTSSELQALNATLETTNETLNAVKAELAQSTSDLAKAHSRMEGLEAAERECRADQHLARVNLAGAYDNTDKADNEVSAMGSSLLSMTHTAEMVASNLSALGFTTMGPYIKAEENLEVLRSEIAASLVNADGISQILANVSVAAAAEGTKLDLEHQQTKFDLDHAKQQLNETQEELADAKRQLQEVRDELMNEMAKLRNETSSQIDTMNAQLRECTAASMNETAVNETGIDASSDFAVLEASATSSLDTTSTWE